MQCPNRVEYTWIYLLNNNCLPCFRHWVAQSANINKTGVQGMYWETQVLKKPTVNFCLHSVPWP